MVSVKGILIATSLLLSGVLAIPFPDAEQATGLAAVAHIESRDIVNYAGETRGLTHATVVNLEARGRSRGGRKKKPKAPRKKNKKTNRKKNKNKKKKSRKNKNKKKKNKSCPMKKKKGGKGGKKVTGRAITDRYLVKAPNRMAITEHEWVDNLVSGQQAMITELTGCTGVFLWQTGNIPIIFHILCGKETEDGMNIMEKVYNKHHKTTTDVWIKSSTRARANRIKDAMLDYLCGLDAEEAAWKAKIHIQPEYPEPSDGMGTTLAVTAGTKRVIEGEAPKTRQQPPSQGQQSQQG